MCFFASSMYFSSDLNFAIMYDFPCVSPLFKFQNHIYKAEDSDILQI